MDASRRTWLLWIASGLLVTETLMHSSSAEDGPQRVIDLRIENRKVVTAKNAIRVTEGEVIALRWASNELVELHLHGYDLKIQVQPGQPALMVVKANATGRFPITSHGWGQDGHGHDALTYLEVYPR